MTRFVKLSKLLKLSTGNDHEAWSTVLSEVSSEDLPAFPELKILGASAEKAKDLKSKTEEVAGTVSNFTQEDYDELKGIANNSEAFDSMLAQLQKTSSDGSGESKISKRAGLWSGIKGMFSLGSRILPFVGVIASAYFLYQNWEGIEAAAATIKQNFKDLGSEGDLYDPAYIGQLIKTHAGDPEKLLSIAKLNKVAKFYKVNVLEWWFNAIMGVCDLINSVVVLATWGAATAIEGLLGSIMMAIGIGSGAGMISVDFFDGLVGAFVANSAAIKGIASQNINQPEPKTVEETYEG